MKKNGFTLFAFIVILGLIINSCGSKNDASSIPGTAEGAKQLAQMFLDAKADKITLTKNLKPNLNDCKALFNDADIAAKAYQMYDEAFKELETQKTPIGPKSSDQTETLITGATSEELKKDTWTGAVYDHFPGGYHKVAPYLNPGLTIYQIKFVKPGESSGMRFDGFVYVNNHWVIFPKMWRIIKDE